MADRFDKLKVNFIDQDESVQVVADTIGSSGDIPERYVRPEIEADHVIIADADSYRLPVIDMSRLINHEFSKEETAKLGSACEDWGFFQLVNHGVDEQVLQQIKDDITGFFKLPLQEKMTVAILPNGLQGFGHHFVFSKEQKLDWVDLMFLTTRPVEERSLDFWPINPPTFRNSLDKYSLEIENVSAKLFKFMAMNLGVDEEALLGTFKGQPQSVRINHYPPCSQADKVLGLSPHTDGVGMTLLLQVNDVQGLQIRKDGKWFAVKNLPGALVVNVGDVLEIITNGKYKSIEHRAVINPDKERITIAAFQSAPLSCTIGPLQELLMKGDPRYRTVDGVEFTKGYFAAKLEGRRYLESLKLGVLGLLVRGLGPTVALQSPQSTVEVEKKKQWNAENLPKTKPHEARRRDESPPAASLPLKLDDEILLRLPPRPSSLPRASLVSSPTPASFHRLFRARHRNHPLIGVFTNEGRYGSISFRSVLDPPNLIPTEALLADSLAVIECPSGPNGLRFNSYQIVLARVGGLGLATILSCNLQMWERKVSSEAYNCRNLGKAMAEVRTIGSLPVPNVQALAGTCNGSDERIPERYIRTEATCEEVISNYHGDMAILIIDLSKLLSPQSSEEERLINHGVPEEVIENFRSSIVHFFSQPLDAKKEYSQLPNSLEGYGQTFVFSEDQKLDWGDMLYLQVHPTDTRDLRFWPTYPASFRQSLDAYSSETKSLALCLFKFMAKAVDADPESLLSIFEDQP
uniref:Fe2OG dioxygenase domain-containing protein n=1 Tax=Leersia perrieri TaxID=77586 RepID=A0A0D9XME3_9ORYZ